MTKIYKIQKGIQIPAAVHKKSNGHPSKVALTMQAMEAGDSFLIADALEAIKAEKVVKDSNGREREKKSGRSFIMRRLPKGLRIWRVK
jgi:hypothetical protein